MQKTLQERSLTDVVEFAGSLSLVALAVVGMGGLIYHTLSPQGLIGPWLGRLWAHHPVFMSLVALGLFTMALAARGQGASSRRLHGRSDLPLYFFVAFGTFFAARWIMNGAL